MPPKAAPNRSPTQWVRFGKEAQRKERAFVFDGSEGSGACADAMAVLKLDEE